jgi:hypothetical protein
MDGMIVRTEGGVNEDTSAPYVSGDVIFGGAPLVSPVMMSFRAMLAFGDTANQMGQKVLAAVDAAAAQIGQGPPTRLFGPQFGKLR